MHSSDLVNNDPSFMYKMHVSVYVKFPVVFTGTFYVCSFISVRMFQVRLRFGT